MVREEDHAMGETCGCHHGKAAVAGGGGRAGDPVGGVRPDETVEAIGRRAPAAQAVLRGFGIDTCCGGGLTLAQAAASAGVPVERVLAALAGAGSAA
jgi:hypothetical protein